MSAKSFKALSNSFFALSANISPVLSNELELSFISHRLGKPVLFDGSHTAKSVLALLIPYAVAPYAVANLEEAPPRLSKTVPSFLFFELICSPAYVADAPIKLPNAA